MGNALVAPPTGTIACPRIGKWFRGCCWEPRYDRQEPDAALRGSVEKSWSIPSGWVNQLQVRETYVRDVCRTCGATVERTHAE